MKNNNKLQSIKDGLFKPLETEKARKIFGGTAAVSTIPSDTITYNRSTDTQTYDGSDN